MNRKQFLGTLFGSVIAIPTLFGITSDKNKITLPPPIDLELQDLYDYLERQTIVRPVEGRIPFKLYPYQKQILKQIHENDKVIFVKARQIGMTTLLAGYVAWRYSKSEVYSDRLNYTFPHILRQYQDGNCNMINRLQYHFLNTYVIRTADELHYLKDPYCAAMSNINKNIIVGTPDMNGVLKKLVDKKDEYGFKVFTYTANDCPEVWNAEKIKRCNMEYLSQKYVETELYCKFV